MIYEKNCFDGFVGRCFTLVLAVRRPIIVLRTDEALKMRSNKIDGSYEIAGRSLKATADDLESDRWGVSTGSPIRSQQRRTSSGQGGNSGVATQFTRQSPGG